MRVFRSSNAATLGRQSSKGLRHILLAAAIAAGISATGLLGSVAHAAPLGYTGGTVSNNMDWLPTNVTNPAVQTITGRGPHEFSVVTGALTPGRDGWQLSNPSGSSGNTEFRAQDGSLAGGSGGRGVNSYGPNGSTDRALGMSSTSNQISTFGLVLQNTSTDTYTGFDISWIGEQWRRGDAGVNTMTFSYGLAANIGASLTNVPSLAWSSPNTANPTNSALNGNLALNQVSKSGTITGLNWLPTQTLVLKWSINDISGQDDGLGIDSFQFTAAAAAVPEPSTLAPGAMAAVGLTATIARRRTRQRRA